MASSLRRIPLVFILISGLGALTFSGGARARRRAPVAIASRARLVRAYGKLPLSFEPNQGQTARQVKFLARGPGYTIFLTPHGAMLSLVAGQRPNATLAKAHPVSALRSRVKRARAARRALPSTDVVRMRLAGSNPHPKVVGLDKLPGRVNYFIGNNPKKWRTNVPTYAKVAYKNIYPGVDLIYHGNQRNLEYDFVLAPGADPSAIRLAVARASRPWHGQDAHGTRIAANGDLVIQTASGEVRFRKPVVYQTVAPVYDRRSLLVEPRYSAANRQSAIEKRKLLDGRFVLLADNEVGFKVANYDHSKPLVIDPTLVYSTLLGGSSTTLSDRGSGIVIDGSGDAYVVGTTGSSSFPTTAGAFQTTFGGGTCMFGPSVTQPCGDVFVTKLNPSGTALVYSTYLGGSNDDEVTGQAIAIDSSGEAYVTGTTFSSNFPVTSSAFQGSLSAGQCNINGLGPCPDAFFTKLNASGSALVYSTYLGGSGPTNGTGLTGANAGIGVAVDSSGNAYLAGATASTTFPTTAGAYQQAYPSPGSVCTGGGGVNGCLPRRLRRQI